MSDQVPDLLVLPERKRGVQSRHGYLLNKATSMWIEWLHAKDSRRERHREPGPG